MVDLVLTILLTLLLTLLLSLLLTLLQAVDIVGGKEEEQGLPASQAQRHVRTTHS